MKKIGRVLMVGLFIFSHFIFFQIGNAADAAKIAGQIGMISGEVLVNSKPVSKGATIREGAVVETKDGKATLLLGKGAVFHLGPNSKMVVNEFGTISSAKKGEKEEKETGDLELKFGRTRALILNDDKVKKDIKIKARAATMGVRGTEIFIDAPQDSTQPTQFFTLDGKAEVKTSEVAAPVVIAQNEGMASSGEAPAMTVNQVKEEIKASGMEAKEISAPREAKNNPPQSLLGNTFGMGSLPPIQFDPLGDSRSAINVAPQFQCAVGTCP